MCVCVCVCVCVCGGGGGNNYYNFYNRDPVIALLIPGHLSVKLQLENDLLYFIYRHTFFYQLIFNTKLLFSKYVETEGGSDLKLFVQYCYHI